MELPLWLPARHLGTWDVGTERAQAAGSAHAAGRGDGRGHLDLAAKTAARRELDDWRAEHRPPKMSAEREAALFRLLC